MTHFKCHLPRSKSSQPDNDRIRTAKIGHRLSVLNIEDVRSKAIAVELKFQEIGKSNDCS